MDNYSEFTIKFIKKMVDANDCRVCHATKEQMYTYVDLEMDCELKIGAMYDRKIKTIFMNFDYEEYDDYQLMLMFIHELAHHIHFEYMKLKEKDYKTTRWTINCEKKAELYGWWLIVLYKLDEVITYKDWIEYNRSSREINDVCNY